MDFIVEFGQGEGVGVESNGVDFIVHWGNCGEDGGEGIVQCICFDNEQSAQNPMCQYWCSGEGLLQHVESRAASVGELPSRAFAGDAGEQDSDVRVMWNKMLVEISKPRKDCMSLILWGSGQF